MDFKTDWKDHLIGTPKKAAVQGRKFTSHVLLGGLWALMDSQQPAVEACSVPDKCGGSSRRGVQDTKEGARPWERHRHPGLKGPAWWSDEGGAPGSRTACPDQGLQEVGDRTRRPAACECSTRVPKGGWGPARTKVVLSSSTLSRRDPKQSGHLTTF